MLTAGWTRHDGTAPSHGKLDRLQESREGRRLEGSGSGPALLRLNGASRRSVQRLLRLGVLNNQPTSVALAPFAAEPGGSSQTTVLEDFRWNVLMRAYYLCRVFEGRRTQAALKGATGICNQIGALTTCASPMGTDEPKASARMAAAIPCRVIETEVGRRFRVYPVFR